MGDYSKEDNIRFYI